MPCGSIYRIDDPESKVVYTSCVYQYQRIMRMWHNKHPGKQIFLFLRFAIHTSSSFVVLYMES